MLASPFARAAAALLLFSGWMGLLFAGFLFHGALHLLLLGAAALFPWRWLPPATPGSPRPGPPRDRSASRE
jgi:hypothetical protein